MGQVEIRGRMDQPQVYGKGITEKSGRCDKHLPDLLIEKHHLIYYFPTLCMCSESGFVSKQENFSELRK